MNRPRVVLATKSYWPHVSETARSMERLAHALSDCGAGIQVVTAQFGTGSQGTYWDGSVPIVRLPHGPNGWWGPMRYWFALADWLKSQRDTFDVVCVSGLHYDAYSASQALATEPQPLVLRAETAGPAGDCQWQATARFGSRVRQRCQQAHGVIAPSAAVAHELLDAGYDAKRITLIANGIQAEPLSARHALAQRTARSTLADAEASLRAPKLARIVLCVDPIHSTEQLPPLLSFWSRVVACVPPAQLWLVGQGRAYDIIPRLAERRGLELSVAAPGMFDDLTEFYQAADLLLLPFETGGQSVTALEAMAIGLPLVARDTPGNRLVLDGGRLGMLVDLEAEQAAEEVAHVLLEPSELDPLVEEAREWVRRECTLQQMGEEHLALFERILHSAAQAR